MSKNVQKLLRSVSIFFHLLVPSPISKQTWNSTKKSVFKDYSYKLLAINFVFRVSELKLRLPLISLNLCFCVCEFVTFNLHTIYEVINFPRNFIISRCNWFMCALKMFGYYFFVYHANGKYSIFKINFHHSENFKTFT